MAMVEQPEGQPFSLRDEDTICFIPDELRRIVQRLLRESSQSSMVSAAKDLYERAEHEDGVRPVLDRGDDIGMPRHRRLKLDIARLRPAAGHRVPL